MWDSDKLELLKISLKVLVLAVFMALMGILLASREALGSQIKEVEPGILQISHSAQGTLVVEKIGKSKNGKWIYLEVTEKAGPSSKVRYFYARAKDFKLLPEARVESLQYGLKGRINNAKGRIPFGQQKYFYQLLEIKTLS